MTQSPMNWIHINQEKKSFLSKGKDSPIRQFNKRNSLKIDLELKNSTKEIFSKLNVEECNKDVIKFEERHCVSAQVRNELEFKINVDDYKNYDDKI